MSLRNVTVESSHGVERLFIRATTAQKKLIKELRANKSKFIEKHGNVFHILDGDEFLRILNSDTVEKLLDQKFLVYVDKNSNKIRLSTEAK